MKKALLLFFSIFLSIISFSQAQHSVLASGNWYKITVDKRGIYKIDYAFLQSLGVNPAQINPAKIRLYGNGGSVLPEKVTNDVIDDLQENAIYVSASGSSFGQNDYILFYANGPIKWELNPVSGKFVHTQNYYEDKSYFFLNFDLGNGKRITSQAATGTATETYTSFDDYAVVDNDTFSPGTVGKQWWGYRLQIPAGGSASKSFNVNMGTLASPVFTEAHVGGIVNASSTYIVSNNNNTIFQTPITNFSGNENINMRDASLSGSFTPPAGNFTINMSLQAPSTADVYLDYMRFNARRALAMSGGGGQLSFREVSSASLSADETAAFQIAGANANVKIWEVTNPLNPLLLNGTLNGTNYKVTRPGGILREFIAFDGSQYLSPSFIGSVANQDLHKMDQADFIIITNNDLLPAAEELATFHRVHDNMSVNIATVDKIYNEFSSGGQDIAGIRNFIKMFYSRGATNGTKPKNVLFFGAASYDYKNRIPNNTNIVPTYQTYNSVNNTSAFSSDDFYALLENGDDINAGNATMDVGIGRIPAYTLEEAQSAVHKIENYKSNTSFGPWKNVFTFTSDNYDWNAPGGAWQTSHTHDAEEISQDIDNASPIYNQVKLYGDVLPLSITPSGAKMVAQTKALNDQMFLGTFLVNYSGHGSPVRLASEDFVTKEVINSWTNINKLPVFVTATCDFGRYDDPSQRSGGASIVMKPDGGSIASITTTQLVYASSNLILNSNYIKRQFNKNADGKWNTLGEALALAKNDAVINNNQKFAMLGDPALTLALPVYNVKTDSLYALKENNVVSDTFNALGRYKLSGSVTDENNMLMPDFNGKVYVTIYDKKQEIPINGEHPPPDIHEYKSQSSTIYKGIGTVTNGKFSLSFVVPKDINYNFGFGKISYYAENGETDAAGADTNFVVGGFATDAPEDNDGPIVQPFIDNDKFREGGVTGPDPYLYVKLYDDNGINVTGSSVGHDLVAILDEDVDHPFVLNNYYETEPNDFRNGTVNFPMANLEEGKHTLRVKAWDTYNNSGEGTVTFEVHNKDNGVISEVYNYPNPFRNQTTFVIQHNLSKQAMVVTIRIYNTSGSLVRTIEENITPAGNRTEIPWDGSSDTGYGMGSGLYFYKVQIKTDKGIVADAQQKLSLYR